MDNGYRPGRRVRHAVQLKATVTRGNGEAVTCTVSDFSLDGCCLSGIFTIGERIEVKVRPIGVQPAEIRWAARGRAGARFLGGSSRAKPLV
ncbi:MAG TPA: PilZ domain-containing protein [Sphingomicrobium sp.]|nr:PilZ domain-containing protein [Sphingomicrobium sp.]